MPQLPFFFYFYRQNFCKIRDIIMSKQSVFLLGPGFIGGEVLNLLAECKRYDVTTLVRQGSTAAAF
jgi:hypothetical protein